MAHDESNAADSPNVDRGRILGGSITQAECSDSDHEALRALMEGWGWDLGDAVDAVDELVIGIPDADGGPGGVAVHRSASVTNLIPAEPDKG
jgi:hypothetical protein